MESLAARRRVTMIASHFASNDEMSALATHVFPMNCSGSLNSVIQRRDNRTTFARQGSGSQAYFMRQVSPQQDINGGDLSMALTNFNKESSIERFRKCYEGPLFSTPVVSPDVKLSAPEPPTFSRPNTGGKTNGNDVLCSNKDIHVLKPFVWSPRMDIGEYGRNYVLVVELPGVSAKDIRVEVNEKSLIVKGNRSTEFWKEVASHSNDPTVSAHHKKEILQGPYQMVWPLPTNADKDNASAEFVDGLLRINIPKL